MAELAKAHSNAALAYILLFKTIMHMGVRNLPKVGWESNVTSAIC